MNRAVELTENTRSMLSVTVHSNYVKSPPKKSTLDHYMLFKYKYRGASFYVRSNFKCFEISLFNEYLVHGLDKSIAVRILN